MPRDPFRSTPNLSPFGPGNNSYTSTPSSHSSRSMGLGFGSGSFSSPYGSFPDSDARRLSSRSASGSVAEKYSLAADPRMWGYSVSPDSQDDDDWLHNPDPKRDKANDFGSSLFTVRGCTNIGCLLVLGIALLGLFAGYPVATYFTRSLMSTNGGFNLGGTNASGQVPSIGNFGLIDLDTPEDVYSITSYTDGSTTMQLVFSDEFNEDGRSFYPGDDPFWEAGVFLLL
ncbi:hypothetical protein VKT23_007495 [Stygiomarasmius scandens]|uniref:Uncharacterized protein n=1 Tax=Marasmiellus scandens TaxID=2682957 RepID=A0ABR1JPQ3_9AGAR